MLVSTTEATASPNGMGATAPADKTQLGKDQFVKLLMAQLGNQDPLSPMDSEAFVAQLAQFATVELLQAQKSSLEGLLVAQAASNQVDVASLVGKEVDYRSDSVTLTEGQTTPIHGNLSKEAGNVAVVVTDRTGKTVRTMQLGPHEAGALEVAWDGRDDTGALLTSGDYKVQLTASDLDGKPVSIEQRAHARITGVSFENGYPELLLGSIRINLQDVARINEPSPLV